MKNLPVYTLLLTSSLIVVGCGGGDDAEDVEVEDTVSSDDTTTDTDDTTSTDTTTDTSILSVDTTLFATTSLVSVETIDCTLSDNSSSTCYSITVSGFPADRTELGSFCPSTTTTGADAAGKWFDDGVLYDLDGEFIANLDLFYGDSTWQLFDPDTGEVFITDTQESCEGAAQPNVAEEFQNMCVQCELSYFVDEEGTGVESTYIIPITPVLRDDSGDVGGSNIGVSLNGVNLAGAAPTEAILSAFTIAAFDDCVGHINPFAGYHYHGANHGDGECPAIDFEADGHGGIFAYALDGFGIYSMLDESGEEESDLDECRGHSDEVRGYHYHTAGAGENAFIGCFSGETAR